MLYDRSSITFEGRLRYWMVTKEESVMLPTYLYS